MPEEDQGLSRIVAEGEFLRGAFAGREAAGSWRGVARLVVLLCGALLSLACAPKARPGTAPEHLLLITIENLRADHVSALGYERRTTALLRPDQPIVLDLDRIATTGVSFARSYAPSSSAQRSLDSLLLGAQLTSSPQPASLAEAFHHAGFRTSCFVTATSLDEASQTPQGLAAGFEMASFHASDEATLAAAVAWLESEMPAGAQHFTWLHLAGIQVPFAGEPFEDRFSAPAGVAQGLAPAAFVAALESGELEWSADRRKHLNDLYDARLLRVVELLNSFFFLYSNNFGVENLWDRSVIAVMGSSACELGDLGTRIGTAHSLREEGLHVPLLVTHRGSLTGERIFADVVEFGDVQATFRDWFGLEPSASLGDSSLEGRSLLAVTDSYIARDFPARPALSVGADGAFSLRSARYRLTVQGGVRMLHDLQMDPNARHDVAPLHPDVVEQLLESSRGRLEALGISF